MERRVEELRGGHGDDYVFDAGSLWRHGDEGCCAAEWSAAGGWRAESATASTDLVRLGRPATDEANNRPLLPGIFVTAEVGGSA